MIYESLGTNLEHHKHLGCCPSITIDKHPCDALPILLCPFLCISFFCWCKGTSFLYFAKFFRQKAVFEDWRYTPIHINDVQTYPRHHDSFQSRFAFLNLIAFLLTTSLLFQIYGWIFVLCIYIAFHKVAR